MLHCQKKLNLNCFFFFFNIDVLWHNVRWLFLIGGLYIWNKILKCKIMSIDDQLCSSYWAEYIECRKFSNMFYHYYTYGNLQKMHCGFWKSNYDDCMMWFISANVDAKNRLLDREEKLLNRLCNKQTDIWNYRSEPPEMWSFPGNLRYNRSKQWKQ